MPPTLTHEKLYVWKGLQPRWRSTWIGFICSSSLGSLTAQDMMEVELLPVFQRGWEAFQYGMIFSHCPAVLTCILVHYNVSVQYLCTSVCVCEAWSDLSILEKQRFVRRKRKETAVLAVWIIDSVYLSLLLQSSSGDRKYLHFREQ